ncbi:Conserved_hypothetical protein [Hexamita inflata]|uniref:Uncharacterized protein n=1 Tax=Hexamita inflata TaxID=28002 RepID=A0AA86QZF8_9EUKA|nr:Conserved hypothetical protein [Hexamita inflata]
MLLMIGTLTSKAESQVRQQFIDELIQKKVLNQNQYDNLIKQYVEPYQRNKLEFITLSNVLKTISVGLLIFASWSIVTVICKQLWRLIAAVPVYVYLVIALSLSITGIVSPQIYSPTYYDWIAVLCAFTTPIILTAFYGVYEKQLEPIVRVLLLPFLPRGIVLNVLFVAYFGALAIIYKSQLIGFAAVVALSSLTSFSVFYMPGLLALGFKQNMLPFLVFGHFIVLSAYSALILTNNFVEYITVFKTGLEYYVSIALATGLHVGSSPLYRKKANTVAYAFFFILLSGIAVVANIFTPLKVPGSVLCGFCFFTILEWLCYLSLKGGALLSLIVITSSLYLFAKFLDKVSLNILAK